MKKILLCIVLFLSVFILISCDQSAFTPNSNDLQANINDNLKSIDQLVEECRELASQIDTAIESQESGEYDDNLYKLINSISSKIETLKSRINQSVDNYKQNNKDAESLESLIFIKSNLKGELQKELDDLKKEIDDLQKQKDVLIKDIAAVKGEPIQLSAGQFFVGEDFPAGRYKIYDSLGHFYLYGSNGSRKTFVYFSDIDDDIYVTEYIYKLVEGDKIECDAKFKIVRID